MRHRFLFNTGTIILALGLMVTSSCKEDTIVKSDITPGDNTLGTESVGDTMTVITKTFWTEKLKTSDKITDVLVVQPLGTIVDQFFGKTNSGLYFQVLPTVNNFSFSTSGFTIDSAVMILPYSGYGWGNRTDPKPQRFKVYRVNEPMSVENDYYSNQDLQVANNLLADVVVDMQQSINDTPTVLNETASFKHIRIPLSNDFIKDVRDNLNTGVFNDDASFLAHFNGFYVAPDSNTNMGNNTDLLSYILFDGGGDYARVAIAFYYTEDGSNESKTAFFNYVRDKTANYSRISRNYAGFPAQSIIDRYSSTINISDDSLLLQNEPGASIDVRIPNIDKLPVTSILKAELLFTVISSGVGADSLQTPIRVTPVGVDAAGEEYEIRDFISSDIAAAVAYVDGVKRIEKDGSGNDITTYRINIPRELQNAIIDKRNELHLRIKGAGAKALPAAYRLITGGRGHGTYKMQLNIVYAKPI